MDDHRTAAAPGQNRLGLGCGNADGSLAAGHTVEIEADGHARGHACGAQLVAGGMTPGSAPRGPTTGLLRRLLVHVDDLGDLKRYGLAGGAQPRTFQVLHGLVEGHQYGLSAVEPGPALGGHAGLNGGDQGRKRERHGGHHLFAIEGLERRVDLDAEGGRVGKGFPGLKLRRRRTHPAPHPRDCGGERGRHRHVFVDGTQGHHGLVEGDGGAFVAAQLPLRPGDDDGERSSGNARQASHGDVDGRRLGQGRDFQCLARLWGHQAIVDGLAALTLTRVTSGGGQSEGQHGQHGHHGQGAGAAAKETERTHGHSWGETQEQRAQQHTPSTTPTAPPTKRRRH